MKPLLTLLCFCLANQSWSQTKATPNGKEAIYLQNISWTEAQKYLTPDALVLIPLGAASKEHGPHLPLSADLLQAEYYTSQIAAKRNVVIAPTINYSYYPPFLKYAGSTSLGFRTARNMLLDVVRSLAGYGPRRFYVVNEGVTTVFMLQEVQKILKEEGILFFFSDWDRPVFSTEIDKLAEQSYGGHASEIETSNILHIRVALVDMKKAENDSNAKGPYRAGLTPVPDSMGNFSPSGIIGYAKLATREKGQKATAATVKGLLHEIDSIRVAPIPVATDRSMLYASLVGTYKSEQGKVLKLYTRDGRLQYVWNNRDNSHFYPLYYNGDESYTSQMLDIVVMRDEQKKISRLWVQANGQQFWMTRE